MAPRPRFVLLLVSCRPPAALSRPAGRPQGGAALLHTAPAATPLLGWSSCCCCWAQLTGLALLPLLCWACSSPCLAACSSLAPACCNAAPPPTLLPACIARLLVPCPSIRCRPRCTFPLHLCLAHLPNVAANQNQPAATPGHLTLKALCNSPRIDQIGWERLAHTRAPHCNPQHLLCLLASKLPTPNINQPLLLGSRELK